MIYLDNAATTLLKPPEVYTKSDEILKKYSANAGRSSHIASIKAAEIIYTARYTIADFLNINKPENVVFTFGCTDSLNMIINGLFNSDDHILTTVYEHNSVLRPLENLKNIKGVDYTVIMPDENGIITEESLEKSIKKNTKAIIVNYVSNVTGIKQNMNIFSSFKRKHNLLLIIDGAQAVGVQNLDFDYDYICCAGHKGLYGPQGIGILGIKNDSFLPRPFRFGGTGTATFSLDQPNDMPEYLESGTLSVQNIAALEQGVIFCKRNSENILNHEKKLTQYLIDNLKHISSVKIYSPHLSKSGVVAFNIDNIHSNEVAEILDKKFGICCRGGFHCAPLLHKYLKTESTGAVRISVGYFNTMEDILYLIDAVEKIVKK
ncbi:MAG: aminotransferase class V-fold PLP-dependent enzyme [Clostridiales bacterium]|nr:aminotransferase class V-fold PLP-dependent enzyme [Clostridiales bacterium]